MKNLLINTFIAFFYLYPINSQAEVSGKSIAYACYSCHGEQLSHLNLKTPLSVQQLSNTLMRFKKNKIENTIMARITKGYTANELKSVASYISGLK